MRGRSLLRALFGQRLFVIARSRESELLGVPTGTPDVDVTPVLVPSLFRGARFDAGHYGTTWTAHPILLRCRRGIAGTRRDHAVCGEPTTCRVRIPSETLAEEVESADRTGRHGGDGHSSGQGARNPPRNLDEPAGAVRPLGCATQSERGSNGVRMGGLGE